MNFSPKKSSQTAKPKNTRYVLKKLGLYLKDFIVILIFALILTIAANLFALIGPKLSGEAIDLIIDKNVVDFNQLYQYIGLLLIFYLVSGILSFFQTFIMIRISQKITRKMRKDVFDSMLKMPLSFFDKYQTGDIISRISYDIDTINASLSSDVVMIISSIVTVVFSFIMMFVISKVLILIFLFTIPASFLITRFFTKRSKKYFKMRSAKLGRMNGYVEEYVTAIQTIQAYNQEEKVIADFEEYNQEAAESTYLADYYSCPVGPGVGFINNLSYAFISIFGALLYFYDQITFGKISSFVMYSRKFSGPINEIANIIAELQSALAAAERVFAILDEMQEINIGEDIVIEEGNVDVKNISFGYIEDRIILNDVSFNAPKGKMVAIVGPTGAGKTTIISLLMRFYDLHSGDILIDNQRYATHNKTSIRKGFSMVLQDTWLFEGSIYENILYGNDNKTKEDVINACKAAKIHNYIISLDKGYDTILKEEGANISKGQKQLLTIARAMLLDCHMLILDEATSNVDTATEAEIQASMLKLMENKTCFVIAHRLSTIFHADLILVVKDGNIIEQGTHKELLNQNGFYTELYNSQYK